MQKHAPPKPLPTTCPINDTDATKRRTPAKLHTATDLNDLLAPGSGWVLESARDINGDKIVGWGSLNGVETAFIIYQTESEAEVPEPATLLLVGSGLAGLAVRWRSKS